jgi:hypothetical protein
MKKIMICFGLFLCWLVPIAAQENSVRITSQRFENGEMIYREDTGEIYILSFKTGRWWRYASMQYGRLPYNP